MNNKEMIKILIIKSPYQGVDKSKLPVVAMAWYNRCTGMYQVDADFLPALRKEGMSPRDWPFIPEGMSPGDWPFRPDEVEVL